MKYAAFAPYPPPTVGDLLAGEDFLVSIQLGGVPPIPRLNVG